MSTPVPVGQELHVGMTSFGPGVEPRTVTLHGARARIVQNTRQRGTENAGPVVRVRTR